VFGLGLVLKKSNANLRKTRIELLRASSRDQHGGESHLVLVDRPRERELMWGLFFEIVLPRFYRSYGSSLSEILKFGSEIRSCGENAAAFCTRRLLLY
jgi:hypothetical protein